MVILQTICIPWPVIYGLGGIGKLQSNCHIETARDILCVKNIRIGDLLPEPKHVQKNSHNKTWLNRINIYLNFLCRPTEILCYFLCREGTVKTLPAMVNFYSIILYKNIKTQH